MLEKRIPFIIDTDPGVDDFFCIAFGVSSESKTDLKGLTTICGNNYVDVTTRNALDILKYLGSEETPVAKGCEKFLDGRETEPVLEFHGANGLGNLEIPHSDKKCDELSASDFIYKTAKECEGELVLVPVGPLTNIAKAITDHPDIVKMVKKIVLMGGALVGGNLTPFAEANTGNDPEATKIVFGCGIPVDMVGLDVTMKGVITTDEFDVLAKDTRPDLKELMKNMLIFRHGDPMHDAIAFATVLDDSFMKWKCGTIDCVLDGEHRGQTVMTSDEGVHRAAVEIDMNRYRELFGEMVSYYK